MDELDAPPGKDVLGILVIRCDRDSLLVRGAALQCRSCRDQRPDDSVQGAAGTFDVRHVGRAGAKRE